MTNIDLPTELAAFEVWASTAERDSDGWPTDYPRFGLLALAVAHALDHDQLDLALVPSILTVLGLDSEDESILELLSEHPQHAIRLAEAGCQHPNYEVRWQLADALGRVGTGRAIEVLRWYLSDDAEYVRRRSLLALRPHDPVGAEVVALSWLRSAHEYSRMVALDTLAVLGSSHLGRALELLAEDESDVVQEDRQRIVNDGRA